MSIGILRRVNSAIFNANLRGNLLIAKNSKRHFMIFFTLSKTLKTGHVYWYTLYNEQLNTSVDIDLCFYLVEPTLIEKFKYAEES